MSKDLKRKTETSAKPSDSTNGPDGWYPNGTPKDGTRFKIDTHWPVFYRKDDKIFWIDKYNSDEHRGWREKGVMFDGDKRTKHNDWNSLEIIPLKEDE